MCDHTNNKAEPSGNNMCNKLCDNTSNKTEPSRNKTNNNLFNQTRDCAHLYI